MNIGIIGLGLIGGTIAQNLNKKHKILGYDLNNDSLNYALEHKIIHKSYKDVKQLIKESDVIYLCIYPTKILDFLLEYEHVFLKDTVIIEISGIKNYLVNQLHKIKRNDIDIILTHPVAGSEKIGVKNSKASIFKDANYVITPIHSNSKNSLDLCESLAKEMGFKNISYITPNQHDEIIAYTSQLTHLLSLSLVNSISTDLDTYKFIGDSYRDLTRISKINESLWSELFITNKENLIKKVEALEEEIVKFKEAINENDTKTIKELMKQSTRIRTSMEDGE